MYTFIDFRKLKSSFFINYALTNAQSWLIHQTGKEDFFFTSLLLLFALLFYLYFQWFDAFS